MKPTTTQNGSPVPFNELIGRELMLIKDARANRLTSGEQTRGLLLPSTLFIGSVFGSMLFAPFGALFTFILSFILLSILTYFITIKNDPLLSLAYPVRYDGREKWNPLATTLIVMLVTMLIPSFFALLLTILFALFALYRVVLLYFINKPNK